MHVALLLLAACAVETFAKAALRNKRQLTGSITLIPPISLLQYPFTLPVMTTMPVQLPLSVS